VAYFPWSFAWCSPHVECAVDALTVPSDEHTPLSEIVVWLQRSKESSPPGRMAYTWVFKILTNLLQKIHNFTSNNLWLHKGSMLNSGNNDREQNWLLLSPRVKRAESKWRATVALGCPRWDMLDLINWEVLLFLPNKADASWSHGSRKPLQDNLVRDFYKFSIFPQQINKWFWLWVVVHISNRWNWLWIHEWKKNMIAWAWHKDRLVDLGGGGGKFTGKKRRDGLVCMYWLMLQLKTRSR
jgi:hypothetical protein